MGQMGAPEVRQQRQHGDRTYRSDGDHPRICWTQGSVEVGIDQPSKEQGGHVGDQKQQPD